MGVRLHQIDSYVCRKSVIKSTSSGVAFAGNREDGRVVHGGSRSQNHLLAALSNDEARPLEQWLEHVALPRGDVLASPGQSIEFAYFPLSGMVSVVALLSEGLGAEVATVGNE